MRLSISDSDHKFLLLFALIIPMLALGFYAVIERKSEILARQKMDGRYVDFVQTYANVQYDIVTLGTSHAELVSFAGVRHFPLSFPFSVPTITYIKAKIIAKHHPEVKVVYLEADDHTLFNGETYDLSKLSPEEKRNSKTFEWNGAFIDGDDEASSIFGEVAPASQDKFLLLKDDIKPIILKRVAAQLMHTGTPPKNESENTYKPSCDMAQYPQEPDLSQETYWSRQTATEKNRMADGVIKQHNLDKPNPLDPIQAQYFEKTIDLLQKNHIDVVLVQYPETAEFAAKKNQEGQMQYNNFIQSVSKKYNVRVIDMRGLSRYGSRFFQDQDHIDGRFILSIGKILMQDYCTYVHPDKTVSVTPQM